MEIGIISAIAALLIFGTIFLFRFLSNRKKSGWEWVQSTAGLAIPDKEPQVYYSPGGVAVYSEIPVERKWLEVIEEGIQETIDNSTGQDVRIYYPPDRAEAVVDVSKWSRFTKLSDYKVLLVKPTYYGQGPATAGCPLIRMYNTVTTAGTVIGYKVISNRGRIDALNPYMVLPFPESEEERCRNLLREGAKHEAEHYRQLNDFNVFMLFSANDTHPQFVSRRRSLFGPAEVKSDCLSH